MKRLMSVMFFLVIALVFSAGAALAANVLIKEKAPVGTYLTDGKGMTLYLFKKDASGKSVCGAANSCVEHWPVFYVEKIEPASGLKAEEFGTITREDGKPQTTYKGMPLYYFYKDKDDDDAYGQGVNNVWYVVNP